MDLSAKEIKLHIVCIHRQRHVIHFYVLQDIDVSVSNNMRQNVWSCVWGAYITTRVSEVCASYVNEF